MIPLLTNRLVYVAMPASCMTAYLAAGLGSASSAAAQEASRPNIPIIWGDDIGWYNISAYNLGVMGYRTPNTDRIAREGALFTDWYGQQSCTAGRAAFITGQSPVRCPPRTIQVRVQPARR